MDRPQLFQRALEALGSGPADACADACARGELAALALRFSGVGSAASFVFGRQKWTQGADKRPVAAGLIDKAGIIANNSLDLETKNVEAMCG